MPTRVAQSDPSECVCYTWLELHKASLQLCSIFHKLYSTF